MLKKILLVIMGLVIIYMSSLNSIEKSELVRMISRQDDRIKRIERLLSGQPLSTVHIADAAITNAKIGNLSADKITTGTLTVKDGTDRARISVLSPADAEIVVLDTDGILVNGGNIVVKNDAGNTIMDVKGLVSATNFAYGSVSSETSQTTTSTSFVGLNDMSLTTPSFTRNAVVEVMFTVQNSINADTLGTDGDWAVNFLPYIDGSPYMTMFISNEASHNGAAGDNATAYQTNTMHLITELGTGEHTITVEWSVVNNSGTGKAAAYRRTLSYVVLGT